MKVDIVTPTRLLFSGEASAVTAPGWDGEFGALPEHDRYLSLLRGGRLVLDTPEGRQDYVIGRGFADISAQQVTILADSCELASEVDKERAARDATEAEAALANAELWAGAAEPVLAKLELARARLSA